MTGNVSAKDIVKRKVNPAELQQKYIIVEISGGMTGAKYDEMAQALEMLNSTSI